MADPTKHPARNFRQCSTQKDMKTKNLVLVVDDTSTWREIFRNLLVEGGYAVQMASDFNKAKSVLAQKPVALAIMDVSLDRNNPNNRDGLKLCSLIARQKLPTKVILVTGTVPSKAINFEDYQGTIAWFCEKTLYDRRSFMQKIDEILKPPSKVDTPRRSADMDAAGPSTRGNALVVEDIDEWQSILQEALQAEGFTVTLLKDYASALGEVRRKPYHLATIDLQLQSSVEEEENRYGRVLIPEMNRLGIPIIVVSAHLTPEEVLADYMRVQNIQIMDKSAFSLIRFRECAREFAVQPAPAKPANISTDLVYKLVQGFLRNYDKLDRDFARRTEIIDLSKKLNEDVGTLVTRLRDEIDRIMDQQLEEAATEEIKLLRQDGVEFSEPAEYVSALLQSLQEPNEETTKKRLWPLRASRMKNILVLEALYRRGQEYENMSSALQKRLAVEQGALNSIRRSSIKDIAAILRSNLLQ
jgi:CheY-like chemotaxis protein